MAIKIVTATRAKTTEEFLQRPIAKCLDVLYSKHGILFEVVKDNSIGLSTLYNSFLDNKEYANDTLVFVHDDVIIEDLFFEEKMFECEHPIIGIAGTKSFDTRVEKLAWHLATQKKEDLVGEVAHAKGNHKWTTVFGPTPSRALIIDGLFIGVNVARVNEANLRFDENFDWHFYDIAFCLRAKEAGLTIGVTDIRVVHFGLGDSMLTPDWEQANEKFRKAYCDDTN